MQKILKEIRRKNNIRKKHKYMIAKPKAYSFTYSDIFIDLLNITEPFKCSYKNGDTLVIMLCNPVHHNQNSILKQRVTSILSFCIKRKKKKDQDQLYNNVK